MVGVIHDSTGIRIDMVSIILLGIENISLDRIRIMYINSTNIPPIIIISRLYMRIKIFDVFFHRLNILLLLVSMILFLWIVNVLFT